MKKLFAATIVALTALPASAAFQNNSPSMCAPVVKRTLAASGVAQSNVFDTAYVVDRSGTNEGVVVGYFAWTRLKSCKSGYVVIEMRIDCSVSQTYTDGACRVPGIEEG